MFSALFENQMQAHAIYSRRLIAIAKKEAGDLWLSEEFNFDPQNRLLIEVTPTTEQIQAIMAAINEANLGPFAATKEGLNSALGRVVSKTTLVSLDTNKNPTQKINIENRYPKSIQAKLLNNQAKGSIVALQQEFYFHLSLTARTYQKLTAFQNDDSIPEKMKQAHQQAMSAVNELIMEAYEEVIKSHDELNLAQLNKELDKIRGRLLPEAHTILMRKIIANTGIVLTAEDFKNTENNLSIKTHAEHLTAIESDVLHTDKSLKLATWTKASDFTSHNRMMGEGFSHRQIITHTMSSEEELAPIPRLQIRTPSLAVKVGFTDTEYIEDVAVKLNKVKQSYHLAEQLQFHVQRPQAFIYNLFTAINDTLGDLSGNLQTQSANHILKGSHLFNAKQLFKARHLNEGTPVFCFVQNISVNGFGDALGYESGNELIEESTLMTDLSLLHTLFDTALEQEKKNIASVFEHYNQFLLTPDRPDFFSQSQQGQEALETIKTLKNTWSKQNHSSIIPKAKGALKQLIAHNNHFNPHYSKLVQALSIFVEEASINGCKSGNERAQAINGRVAILDSHLMNENSTLNNLLSTVATGTNLANNLEALKLNLDADYNAKNLQGAASLVSLLDQGAAAKVEAKPNHPFYISRNYSEEPEMTNLHQTKSGAMQAHHQLTHFMQGAWEGHPHSWWTSMKSNPLGFIGAIIGLMTVIPAILVAIFNASDNSQKKLAVDKNNQRLQNNYNPLINANNPMKALMEKEVQLNSNEKVQLISEEQPYKSQKNKGDSSKISTTEPSSTTDSSLKFQ